MTITNVSSYANYLSTVRTLRAGQDSINDLTTQLTTAVKSTDLSAYGPDTGRLLGMRSEAARRTVFSTQIDTVMPRVKATQNVLAQLDSMASDLMNLTNLPAGAGQPSVTAVDNPNAPFLTTKVDTSASIFTQSADYTVTVIPAPGGAVDTYDITVNDGLGGRAVMKLNTAEIPPGTKDFDFDITGGPGDGTKVRLSFDQLNGPGTSTFSVRWPQNDSTRERVLAKMNDLRNYLNERIGDRYLFAGSRFSTAPVSDISAVKQQTKITLDGAIGKIGDTYEIAIGGQRFSYTTDGLEASFQTIAANLASKINNANPSLGITASSANGIISLAGNTVGQKFDVDAVLIPSPTVSNTVDATVSTNPVIAGVPSQQDDITFNGAPAAGSNPSVDIGDVYSVTIKDALGKIHTYSVPITSVDYDILAPAPQASIATQMDAVVQKLVAQINADASSGVTASSVANASGSSTLSLTAASSAATSPFTSFGTVRNVGNLNTITTRTLPAMGNPVSLSPVAIPPGLPVYDVDFVNGQNPDAWVKADVSVDDDQKVSYGVTSTDPAFQKLVKALQMARIAVDNPGQYEHLISDARTQISEARDSIRTLESRVILSESSLNAARDTHQQRLTDLTGEIASIEGVDKTQVSAQLQQAMTSLQASYTVAGRTAQLSLVNFLT